MNDKSLFYLFTLKKLSLDQIYRTSPHVFQQRYILYPDSILLSTLSPDEILEMLKDSQWYDIVDIAETLSQPEKLIKEVLHFYEKFDFIQFDKVSKKVIIDPQVRELFR